jgi:hypothetical protein
VTSLVGSVEYRRGYYHCAACHHGWHPTDAELQLETARTRGAQEVISLGGIQEAFAECADRVLHRLSGLKVSGSTVQRVTEAVGQDVAERRASGESIGPAEAWPWPRDSEGRTTAYVSLDATGVPQQGTHGERAEGRMVWVGSVFAPVPREARAKRRLRRVRYVSGLISLEEIGRQLRQECQALSIDKVDTTICLTDGGNGLEACLAESVLGGLSKQTVTILDFYHCAEHLSEFIALWVGSEHAEAESAQWRHRLKHEGGKAVLNELEALDLTNATSIVKESHRLLCGYLRSNQHRIDYPTYLARGWEIGSGEIESACKTIVNQRLKSAGMRWRPSGTTAVCQLRALFKSDPILWQSYWSTTAAI